VIGLTTGDPRFELLLAVNAVATALPHASLDRQHALAVGGIVCRDALLQLPAAPAASGGPVPLDARVVDVRTVSGGLDAALTDVPEAHGWATRFLERNSRWRGTVVSPRQSQATIAMSVDGVRSACASFPDERLRALLATSISLGERFVAAERAAAAPVPARPPVAERSAVTQSA
jgi:hypothetical protein